MVAPLRSNVAQRLVIIPHEARAQRNKLIQRYQWKPTKNIYIYIYIYSCLGSGPANVPTSEISSYACTWLLFKEMMRATCSMSYPSGNLLGGLPLVASAGVIMICVVSSLSGLTDPQLALRGSPAVTWLAVYRWFKILYCRRVIPVRIVLAQLCIHNYVLAGDLWSISALDCSIGMSRCASKW